MSENKLSKAQFGQVLASLPPDADDAAVDKAVKEKESSLWERLNKPLTDLPSKIGKAIGDKLDTRSLDQSPNMARLKGFFAGAAEGAGNLASDFTSPVNLATTTASIGAAGAAKAGLTGLSRGARAAEVALNAPMALQGINQVANGKDAGEKGMGLAQLAGGVAGIHGGMAGSYKKAGTVHGYHGSTSKTPTFEMRDVPQDSLRHWTHFADDPEIGAAYAGDGGTVVKAALDIQRPLDVTKPLKVSDIRALAAQGVSRHDIRNLMRSIADKDDYEAFSAVANIEKDYPNAISKAGFDGIRHNLAEDEGQPAWAVRDPKQINPTSSLWADLKKTRLGRDQRGKVDFTGKEGIGPESTPQTQSQPQEKGPIFINKAIQVVEQRVPKGAKLPPNKFRDLMLGNGVTKGFLDDMDMDTLWKGAKSVSREDVLTYLRNNDPEFQEIKLGGTAEAINEKAKAAYAQALHNFSHEADVPIDYLDEYIRRYNDGAEAFRDMPPEVEATVRGRVLGPRLQSLSELLDEADTPTTTPNTEYHGGDLQLPGDKENYTELLLGIKDKSDFDQPHFPGLAREDARHNQTMGHTRFNTRKIGGKKTLFVEEIQSDLHQTGKKKGYQSNESEVNPSATYDAIMQEMVNMDEQVAMALNNLDNLGFDSRGEARRAILQNPDFATRWDVDSDNAAVLNEWRNLNEERMAAQQGVRRNSEKVPNYPFKQNWHEVMMKRAIREAAEQGAEQIGWTTGKQQAERYGLEKHFKNLRIDPVGYNPGEVVLRGNLLDGSPYSRHVDPDELPELVGQDLAKRLTTQVPHEDLFEILVSDAKGNKHSYPSGSAEMVRQYQNRFGADRVTAKPITGKMKYPTLTGDDLKYGGEGMRAFYDELLPGWFNKYGKPMGSKAQLTPTSTGRTLSPEDVKILEAEHEHLDAAATRIFKAGQAAKGGAAKQAIMDKGAELPGMAEGIWDFINQAKANEGMGGPVWTAPMTPELIKKALGGQEIGQANLALLLAMAGGTGAAALPPIIIKALQAKFSNKDEKKK